MRTAKILCILTLSLFFLVMAQGRWHFIPMRPLEGASSMEELPRPSRATLLDGTWQVQMGKYAKYNCGFREPAIRLYNQYLWSCYNQTTNKGIVPGKDGYLYERYFVEDHYESRMYEYTDDPQTLLDKFDREARCLAMLQELLREQGTTLFVAVLPGKDILYPEHLAPRDTMTRTPGPRAYPEYIRLFDKYGVQYVDILSWFMGMKGKVPYDLMTPQGTHWSNIAATYAFDSIMRYMQGLGGAPIRPVKLGKPYVGQVRDPDDDLARLLNVRSTPHAKEYRYVDVSYPGHEPHSKPGIIVIGDSFFWTVTYNYSLDALFRYTHYWFYNNTIYFDPEHDNVSQVDLRKALADADYVMLSYCSGQLYVLGNEFIGDALVQLAYTNEEIDVVRQNICDTIRADAHWMEYLTRKAEQDGISVDEAIANDANYLIHTRPEKYFENLNRQK